MATIKKIGKKYYIVRDSRKKQVKAWWRGASTSKGKVGANIKVGYVYVPKELTTKKLRIKVEIIEDITKEKEFLLGK